MLNIKIENLKKLFESPWPLVVISLLIISIWFRSFSVLGTGEDGAPFVSSRNAFNQTRYVWSEVGTGQSHPLKMLRIPVYLFAAILEVLKFPPFLIQAIIFFALFLSGGLGMYYLASVLYRGIQERYVWLISALFYMFNLFVLNNVWNRFLMPVMAVMPLIPILLAFFILYLRKKQVHFIFLFCLSSLLLSVAYEAPAHVIITWLPIILYFLFHILINIKNVREVLFTIFGSFTLGIFWIFTNIWWLYPFFNLSSGYFYQQTDPGASFRSLQGISRGLSFHEVFRLLHRYFMFETKIWGLIYSSTFFKYLSWLIPIIAVIGAIAGRKKKFVCYLSLLFPIVLFFSKGLADPYGNIFEKIFKLHPFLSAFRNPYEKVGVLLPLSFSFFFSLGIVGVVDFFKRIKPNYKILPLFIGGILCFLSFVVYVWPMWTGSVFAGDVGKLEIKIPPFYRAASQYLSGNKEDYKLLQLPLANSEGITYKWPSGYSGKDFLELMFPKPFIFILLRLDIADRIIQSIPELISSKYIYKIFSLLNIKNIILNFDIDYVDRGLMDSNKVEERLDNLDSVTHVKSFGNLKIYEIKANKFLEHIFVPKRMVYYQNVEDFLTGLKKSSFEPTDEAFISEEDSPYIKYEATETPKVFHKKITPTLYEINVSKAKEPFVLVFSETYHPDWQLLQDSEVNKKHFLVNGYANGYFVEKTGDYKLTLKFLPQDYLETGMKISSLAFLALIFVVILI